MTSMELDSEFNRRKRRDRLKEHRSCIRNFSFDAKRLHLGDVEEEYRVLTLEEVRELAQTWKRRKEDHIVYKLKRAFGQGTGAVETFLKVDGALSKLIGVLTGNDAALQLEAAACFVNLFLAEHKVIKRAVHDTTPYLITFLTSSSLPLTELCAWALGNIAADCPKCCESLKAQQFLQAIFGVLHTHGEISKRDVSTNSKSVLHSAMFALAQYIKNMSDDWSEILASGLLNCLPSLFRSIFGQEVQEQASVAAFYLSTRRETANRLLHSRCIEEAIGCLASVIPSNNTILVDEQPQKIHLTRRDQQIATFVIRTLANVWNDMDDRLASKEWECIGAMMKWLLACNYPHLQKESLWLLANMTADSISRLQEYYCGDNGLATQIIDILANPICPSDGIFLQGLTCLINILTMCKGTGLFDDICPRLKNDLLENLLSHPDSEVRLHALVLVGLARTVSGDASLDIEGNAGLRIQISDLVESDENKDIQSLAAALLPHLN